MNRWIIGLAIVLLTHRTAVAELPSAAAESIDRALSSGQPTLIDLGARTCNSCRKMAPLLETLSREYRGKANVLFIDVNEDREAAKKFGIRLIPTQIFFDGRGREVRRHIGFMDRPQMIKELKSAGLK